MIKRVVRSLGSLFKEARRRGLSNTGPTIGVELDLPDRNDPRPVIPTKQDLQAIIAGAAGRWRPLFLVDIGYGPANFAGCRGPMSILKAVSFA